MNAKYKILFLVELLHDYYRNLQCGDFNIIPSADTFSLLRDRQMLCKMVGNKFIVLVKTGSDDKPVVPIPGSAMFRFYLELLNPHFLTVTRLDLGAGPMRKLYFNNLTDNKKEGYAYLTEKHPDHDNTVNYKKTDIVVKDAEVYECTREPATGEAVTNTNVWEWRNKIVEYKTDVSYSEGDLVNDNGIIFMRRKDGPAGKSTSDTLFWQLRSFAGLAQYVTENDSTELTPFVKEFAFDIATAVFDIKISGLNIVNNKFDQEILSTQIITGEPVKKIKIDFSEIQRGIYTRLQPGRYNVQINGSVYDLYLDNEAYAQNAFGIIDIFNHLPGGSDYGLLDGGKVKESDITDRPSGLNYTIRFANRLAYWKYLTPRHGVQSIAAANGYSFAATESAPGVIDFFISNKQIPLAEAPKKFTPNLFIQIIGDKKPVLPNPDPAVAGMMMKDEQDDYYCSINLVFNKR